MKHPIQPEGPAASGLASRKSGGKAAPVLFMPSLLREKRPARVSFPASHRSMCAVFSGGRTALLLSPGTGVCKPALARRRDTDRRRRQVTKLPRPIPQYPPFILRYGFFAVHPASAALPAPDSQPGVARAFDAIVLTGRGRGFTPSQSVLGPQAVLAIVWLIQDATLAHWI